MFSFCCKVYFMYDIVNIDYIEKFSPKLDPKPQSTLEIGSYNVNGNCKSFKKNLGLSYLGCDIKEGTDVDVICDITSGSNVKTTFGKDLFDLVICMNVLEHVYRPINALENMCSLLSPTGYLLVVVLVVWDLHDFPADFYRLNPDFFKIFASHNALRILENSMLFPLRENRQFFSDTKTLATENPQFGKNYLKSFMYRKLRKKHPEIQSPFSHTYLNMIFTKSQRFSSDV